MTFSIFQTYQAALEASARELAAKQLALFQSVSEKQKDALQNPAALVSTEVFAQSQAFVQEFAAANQEFVTANVQATQVFWRDQLAENQALFKASGVAEAVEQVQAAVKKAADVVKPARAKR